MLSLMSPSFCMQNEGDIKLNMEPPRCTFYIVLLPPHLLVFFFLPHSLFLISLATNGQFIW